MSVKKKYLFLYVVRSSADDFNQVTASVVAETPDQADEMLDKHVVTLLDWEMLAMIALPKTEEE